MPPRKRAATKAATNNKKAKTEPEPEPEPEVITKDNVIAKLKEADKNDKRPKLHLVDKHLDLNQSLYSVYLDYDCMLNQTNIGHNNNKFYIIQVLVSGGKYYCWNRWGRVGEIGANNGLENCGSDVNKAIKSFEKKFKDKTSNDWNNRSNFVPKSGKYTLIEMDTGAGDDEEEKTTVTKSPTKSTGSTEYRPSKLEPKTQELVELIFNTDMFKQALASYDLNAKKMPLGKLSKGQIAKGFEVLEEIENCLKSGANQTKLNELASKFYTVIPQDFGRQRPPPINNQEALQKKYDMLIVLSDIELAQSMQEQSEKDEKKKVDESTLPPHPADINYDMLKCGLDLVDKKSKEFQIIDTYTKQTQGWSRCQIIDVWKVERDLEGTRFKEHDSLENRKLLWHGTSVAVVAAILKTGLRIMPHSGGRVGRGIYFASENGKSAGYVGTTAYKSGNVGIMFLNEVALGKEHHITRDDSSLTKPPSGFDCVIAKGQTEPDPKHDTELVLDGKKVIVPQGKPIKSGFNSSSFAQSEYLVYKESQCRIRYLLLMNFS